MSRFIDGFPTEKLEATRTASELKERISAALEQLSVLAYPVDQIHTSPSFGNKKRSTKQLSSAPANAAEDAVSLLREGEKRRDDIKRVQALEQKLNEELSALQKQAQTLAERVAHVADIDELRAKALTEKEVCGA